MCHSGREVSYRSSAAGKPSEGLGARALLERSNREAPIRPAKRMRDLFQDEAGETFRPKTRTISSEKLDIS
jgi:hypothetical protein